MAAVLVVMARLQYNQARTCPAPTRLQSALVACDIKYDQVAISWRAQGQYGHSRSPQAQLIAEHTRRARIVPTRSAIIFVRQSQRMCHGGAWQAHTKGEPADYH
eukprot:scpid37442/ scgid11921/ 